MLHCRQHLTKMGNDYRRNQVRLTIGVGDANVEGFPTEPPTMLLVTLMLLPGICAYPDGIGAGGHSHNGEDIDDVAKEVVCATENYLPMTSWYLL